MISANQKIIADTDTISMPLNLPVRTIPFSGSLALFDEESRIIVISGISANHDIITGNIDCGTLFQDAFVLICRKRCGSSLILIHEYSFSPRTVRLQVIYMIAKLIGRIVFYGTEQSITGKSTCCVGNRCQFRLESRTLACF